MSDADQHTSELEHKLLKLLNSSYAPNASVTSDNPPQTQNHRRIKVSRGSVRIFIDGFDLVRRGIRCVYIYVLTGSGGCVNGPRHLARPS